MIRVLFVCMGNICRSPTAEGVFRHLVAHAGLEGAIDTDSAGTHGFHVGSEPDARAQEAAARRGIDISDIRSRRVDSYDFEAFDYILAMDGGNLAELQSLANTAQRERVHAFLDFATRHDDDEVPDPYYGPHGGFEHVFNLVEDASQGLLARIRQDHGI